MTHDGGAEDNGKPWLRGTTGEHNHYTVHKLLPLTVIWTPTKRD
jgi:hypothetical protein